MTDQITLLTSANGVPSVPVTDDAARAQYIRNLRDTMAGETFRAYRSRLAAFSSWCERVGRQSMPADPDTISLYLAALEAEGKRPATICQVVAAISKAHKAAGYDSPCSSDKVKMARKAAVHRAADRGEGAPRQKEAATLPVLRSILSGITGGSLIDKRDRALLLMGFFGAFRRSELGTLRVSDLHEERSADGRPVIVVTLRKSKTDQEGHGMAKAIFAASGRDKSACPVKALREWIAAAGLAGDDVLFQSIRKGGHATGQPLSGHAVARIVQERAAAAGVEMDLAGHSLRRGFVTEAVAAGATERAIMHQTGHKSATTVRLYMERHDAITDNAASMIA